MANYYHYTSGKGLFGILSSSTLQCTHIDYLNDPTENKYLDSVLEDFYSQYPEYKKLYDKLHNQSIEDIVFPFTYYVASFSKKSDSLHMWNYYANGNGYNIEMDIDSIKSLNKNQADEIFIKNVIYDPQKQIDKLIEFFNNYKVQYDDNNEKMSRECNSDERENYIDNFDIIQFNFSAQLLNFKFLFKHYAYRHEEEVRLVICKDYTSESKNDNIGYKTSDSGVIIQFTTLKLDLKDCIKSITIHPAASDLHQFGAHMFLISKIGYVDKSKVKKSMVPFRII